MITSMSVALQHEDKQQLRENAEKIGKTMNFITVQLIKEWNKKQSEKKL